MFKFLTEHSNLPVCLPFKQSTSISQLRLCYTKQIKISGKNHTSEGLLNRAAPSDCFRCYKNPGCFGCFSSFLAFLFIKFSHKWNVEQLDFQFVLATSNLIFYYLKVPEQSANINDDAEKIKYGDTNDFNLINAHTYNIGKIIHENINNLMMSNV